MRNGFEQRREKAVDGGAVRHDPVFALEGFGLVTVEALACGTPVLGTPVGATPELLKPLDPALLARDASTEALAEGILAFLKRPKLDPLTLREYVETRYTLQKHAAGVEAVYQEIIKENGRS